MERLSLRNLGWQRSVALLICAVSIGGCAIRFSQRSPWDVQQIQQLSEQLEQYKTLAQLKSEEADQLRQAKALLDKRLSSEISNDDIDVGFSERGLVVRVLDKVLFDSGKANLRQEAYPVLDKVAKVLNDELVDQPVSVEGHTDNEPIKKSGWKDNWELSMARADSVLKYLVEQKGVNSGRISAVGYGETRPIASNDAASSRRMNRRVEMVVMPQGTAKPKQLPNPADSSGTSYVK